MTPSTRLDVEAVLWDVGGVILDVESVRTGHERFLAWLADEHDLEAVDVAVETWRREVGDYFREREGTAFRPAREAYDRAIAAVVGDPLDRSAWHPRFRAVLAEHLRPNPGATETVTRLAETDLHQGVVSDVDADEGRFILDHLGILDHFDAVTTSEDVGRTKPDPAMFEAALGKAGVAPDRAVMVGDRYRHDMAGAAALGIHTAAYGAEPGAAVDHRLAHLEDLLPLLGHGP